MEHCDAKVLFGDQKRLKGLESLTNVKKIITTYTPDDSFESFDDFTKSPEEWPDIDINRDDHATIYYTSGSTGSQKESYRHNVESYLQCLVGHLFQLF